MNSPASLLIERLNGVKETGRGKWQAVCPSHDDKHPSLNIKERDDGALLLKCWAGCSADEIVSTVGLELADLFPKSDNFDQTRAPRREMRPWSALDVLRALTHEVSIVAVCAGRLNSAGLTPEDAARLSLATQRLWAAGQAVNV